MFSSWAGEPTWYGRLFIACLLALEVRKIGYENGRGETFVYLLGLASGQVLVLSLSLALC